MSKKGKFIVIEGVDGVGKSTFIQKLHDNLTMKGIESIILKDPVLEEIKEALVSGELSNLAQIELFAYSRKVLIEKYIKPALVDGKTVLCDRYILSNFAYQGVDMYSNKYICQKNQGILMPDLTIILNDDFENIVKRISSRDDNNNFDKDIANLKRVYDRYQDLIRNNNENLKVVSADANLSDVIFEVIFDEVLQLVQSNSTQEKYQEIKDIFLDTLNEITNDEEIANDIAILQEKINKNLSKTKNIGIKGFYKVKNKVNEIKKDQN